MHEGIQNWRRYSAEVELIDYIFSISFQSGGDGSTVKPCMQTPSTPHTDCPVKTFIEIGCLQCGWHGYLRNKINAPFWKGRLKLVAIPPAIMCIQQIDTPKSSCKNSNTALVL